MYDKTQIKPCPSLFDGLSGKPRVLKMENHSPMGKDGTMVVPIALSEEDWQDIVAYAYAHGTMVDMAAERVLGKLKELGLDENTLIICITGHSNALSQFCIWVFPLSSLFLSLGSVKGCTHLQDGPGSLI